MVSMLTGENKVHSLVAKYAPKCNIVVTIHCGFPVAHQGLYDSTNQ